MYDPTVGRWISEDPIGFQAADPNLYRYALNRPTNLTDPSGLQPPEYASDSEAIATTATPASTLWSPSSHDSFRYTIRERSVELQLQSERPRWYNPATKRWVSQDTQGVGAGDSNLVRYVNNEPACSTDPSVLCLSYPPPLQVSPPKTFSLAPGFVPVQGQLTKPEPANPSALGPDTKKLTPRLPGEPPPKLEAIIPAEATPHAFAPVPTDAPPRAKQNLYWQGYAGDDPDALPFAKWMSHPPVVRQPLSKAPWRLYLDDPREFSAAPSQVSPPPPGLNPRMIAD
jgi:RHS repeat-associated protein